MSIDKLSAGLVEEGKEHPFVEALVGELRARRLSALTAVVGLAHSGSDLTIRHHASRAHELTEVLSIIERAKGAAET